MLEHLKKDVCEIAKRAQRDGSVSYTHLDVYKRQILRRFALQFMKQ